MIIKSCNNLSALLQKKQTDSNSGARMASQTADNAQESNHASKKKEKGLGTNGHDSPKESINVFCKEEEGQSKTHLQQSAEEQSHTFSFKFKKHAKTVLYALNTNKVFRNNKEKEIVIQRSKGAVPGVAVKTDFPCCLLENDELLDITFIKNSGNVPSKKKQLEGIHSLMNQKT